MTLRAPDPHSFDPLCELGTNFSMTHPGQGSGLNFLLRWYNLYTKAKKVEIKLQ